MIIFQINSESANLLTVENSNDYLKFILKLNINKENNFIILSKNEIKKIAPLFKIDERTLIDIDNDDDQNAYLYFEDHDFISFIFYTSEKKSIEFNIYIFKNNLFFVHQDKIPDNDKYITLITDAINFKLNKFIKNKKTLDGWTNKVLSVILDVIISKYSEILEKIEDIIWNNTKSIQKNIDEDKFSYVLELHEISYNLKKQIRSFANTCIQIANDEDDDFIDNIKFNYLFDSIEYRCNNLLRFVESVEHLSDECIKTFDLKVQNKTNMVMKRLTSITIIFSIWMIVSGIYGMNFKYMPELEWKWGFLFVILFLVLLTIILIFLFKKKKWL